MTTHIANCGYSNLFTAGLFKVGLGQSTPSDAQRPFLDHLHQTSPSPRTLLPPSDSSLHGSQHHIQVPEPGLRSFHIVKSTSPIQSSVLNAWLLNDRRRDITGLSSAGSTLQSLSALAEPDGSCDLPQPVSRIKRLVPARPIAASYHISLPHIAEVSPRHQNLHPRPHHLRHRSPFSFHMLPVVLSLSNKTRPGRLPLLGNKRSHPR